MKDTLLRYKICFLKSDKIDQEVCDPWHLSLETVCEKKQGYEK